jgi:hypothetical protein
MATPVRLPLYEYKLQLPPQNTTSTTSSGSDGSIGVGGGASAAASREEKGRLQIEKLRANSIKRRSGGDLTSDASTPAAAEPSDAGTNTACTTVPYYYGAKETDVENSTGRDRYFCKSGSEGSILDAEALKALPDMVRRSSLPSNQPL